MNRIIRVRVATKAKENSLKGSGDNFKVRLTAAPVGGKANKTLISVLADYFSLKKSRVKIVKGARSRDKLVSLG